MKTKEWLKHNNPDKVKIEWSWEDVKNIRPNWEKKRCVDAMHSVSRRMKDTMIEQGWEILEESVNLFEIEQNKEGNK